MKQEFTLSKRSLERLSGAVPPLQRVFKRAIQITPIDFTILEVLRSPDRQRELFMQGASKTMNSRHLDGNAVDVAPLLHGKVSWDWPLYFRLAEVIKQAAAEVNVPIEWGGDWENFKDGPHWQTPW